ncbi:hypothetical protein [Uliginosibacterium sp. TH139]|uniref:hypothetical protein n=2 Tax=unclassified Uliginosibacterium TaxID=2621521 RepID=UPI000C7A8E07|nr:hypothetical protein [Uliginosibacterium sp. TH139]
MSSRQRLLLMLPLLAIAGWLALFGDKTPPEEQVAMPSRGISAPAAASPGAPAAEAVSEPEEARPGQVKRLGARMGLVERGQRSTDLFSGTGSAPPPPAPAENTPPPPPPEQPFILIGRMLEAGRWQVFLERNGVAWALREGEVADGFKLVKVSSNEVRLLRETDKTELVIPIDGDKRD